MQLCFKGKWNGETGSTAVFIPRSLAGCRNHVEKTFSCSLCPRSQFHIADSPLLSWPLFRPPEAPSLSPRSSKNSGADTHTPHMTRQASQRPAPCPRAGMAGPWFCKCPQGVTRQRKCPAQCHTGKHSILLSAPARVVQGGPRTRLWAPETTPDRQGRGRAPAEEQDDCMDSRQDQLPRMGLGWGGSRWPHILSWRRKEPTTWAGEGETGEVLRGRGKAIRAAGDLGPVSALIRTAVPAPRGPTVTEWRCWLGGCGGERYEQPGLALHLRC